MSPDFISFSNRHPTDLTSESRLDHHYDVHQNEQGDSDEREEVDRTRGLVASKQSQQKWKGGCDCGRHSQPREHDQWGRDKNNEGIGVLLQDAVARPAGAPTDPQAQMVPHFAKDMPWREFFSRGKYVPAKVTPKCASQQVEHPGDDEEPGGKKMKTPRPTVLIEDLVVATRAYGTRRALEEGLRLLPSTMSVITTDGQLDQCRREVVPNLSPVESRVNHQNEDAGHNQCQNARTQYPVEDPHPTLVTADIRRCCDLFCLTGHDDLLKD